MKQGMRCSECGVVLRDRPASCPLCGTTIEPAKAPEPARAVDEDEYHGNVRSLRDELRRLRGDAEAV